MLTALLLIFVGYILYKVFMFKRRVDAMRDDLRRQFEDVEKQFAGASNGRRDDIRKREKKYRSNDGEYVDFEEVRGETYSEPQVKPDTDPGAKRHAHEELISDAEFEEIN